MCEEDWFFLKLRRFINSRLIKVYTKQELGFQIGLKYLKFKLILHNQCQNHSSSHLILLPLAHSPSLLCPVTATNVPLPCYLPFAQFPMYFLPSGHRNVPYPCFLSSIYSPSYFLPSGHVKTPLPCILLFFHSPS